MLAGIQRGSRGSPGRRRRARRGLTLRGSGEYLPVRAADGEQGSTSAVSTSSGPRASGGCRGARPDSRRSALPVGTPGYLSMGACRTGRPFVYTAGGRLTGSTSSWLRRSPAGSGSRSRGANSRAGPRCARGEGHARRRDRPGRRRRPGHPHIGGRTQSARCAHHHQARRTSRARRPCSSGFGRRRGGRRPPGEGSHGRTTIPSPPGRSSSSRPTAVRPTRSRLGHVHGGGGAGAGRLGGGGAPAHLAVAQSVDVGAYDVFVAKGPDAIVVAAIDQALGRLIRVGRYTLLFAKNFPGTPVPAETGT